MARYQASIQGSRGEASRLGSPSSGITAMARGWEGGAKVVMWEGEDGEDYISISVGPHSNVGQVTIVNAPIKALIAQAQHDPDLPLVG